MVEKHLVDAVTWRIGIGCDRVIQITLQAEPIQLKHLYVLPSARCFDQGLPAIPIGWGLKSWERLKGLRR